MSACLGAVCPYGWHRTATMTERPEGVFKRSDSANVRVRNLTRDVVLGDAVGVADSSAQRRAGLLKRHGLSAGEGLWIVPCEAVHTFGMKFPIDVAFLSKSRKVLKVRTEMPRRRFAVCITAHSVLELPAGLLSDTGTLPGDQLEFER
jgi:uncharacterized protein